MEFWRILKRDFGMSSTDARLAKLYYLRDRVGKSRRLRDQRRGLKHVTAWDQMVAAGGLKPAEATESSDD